MDQPEGAPIASVEGVRDELRRLGYLDSSLDRFVLGGAGGPSPFRASLRAAARVGLLGGVLFGLAGTLTAAALDTRLLAEPQDLLVLTLYLLVAFGLATALAALAGGFLADWAIRLGRQPGPTLPRNVGFLIGLAGLIYVGFWWRSHLAGAPLPPQAVALGLGLGLSLTLGRFGSLAAVAVLSAGVGGEHLPPASLSRRHVVPLLAVAAVVFGGGVAAGAYFGRPAAPDVPDFAVVPTGVRVRVLGIDGLESRMTVQQIGGGEMPRLAALLAKAARGRLQAEPERIPAIVWTTIATGRGPEAHGIQSAEARHVRGLRTALRFDARGPFSSALGTAADLLRLTRTQPPSSVLREVKAFWNVASDKGLRIGVVNWWATWPGDPVNGYVVTDRAVFKLEKGGPLDREVYPAEVFEALRPLLVAGGGAEGRTQDRARRLDRFHADAARALRGSNPPDLEALYLPGLDILTMQQLGEAPASDLASLDKRLAAVRDYYRFVDGLIGEATADRGSSDLLVLVADPGRLARGAAHAEGMLAVLGPAVQPGDLGVVSPRDVAPTVLHLLGLPVSRELDGRVLEAALTTTFRAANPLRFVASYGRRPPARAAESAFDRDMLEELRSLGYIR